MTYPVACIDCGAPAEQRLDPGKCGVLARCSKCGGTAEGAAEATIADVLEGRARWCVVEARPKRRPNVSVKCQRPGCLMWRTLYWHPSRPLPQFCSIGCRNAVTVATRTDVGRGGADHWSWRGDSIKRRSGWSRAERSFHRDRARTEMGRPVTRTLRRRGSREHLERVAGGTAAATGRSVEMTASHKHNFKDITGARFGRWVVVAFVDARAGNAYWLCVCDCGTRREVDGVRLRRGRSRSCGCLAAEESAERARTHGMARHGSEAPEYRAWCAMLQRCLNPRNRSFRHYGGRGIRVHVPRVESFEVFLADVGRRPTADHSIDRINNNGHYEPGNVRWATRSEQAINRRYHGFHKGRLARAGQIPLLAGVGK